VFDFFLILMAVVFFFVLFGSILLLGKSIDIGRPALNALARAFIPVFGILMIVASISFSAFTVLLFLQLRGKIDEWGYVFLTVVIMWVCYAVIALFTWINIIPALLALAQIVLLYLQTIETISWSYYVIVIPMYVWAVYAVLAPFVFVAPRKRCGAVFSAA
jgi:hypothetical protein